MSIIAFNFTKISAEKKQAKKASKIEIQNNVAIKEIGEPGLNLASGDNVAVKVEFEFETKFEPEMGNIVIAGNLISLEKKDAGEKLLNGWKDGKKVDAELMKPIMNSILAKANVQALIMSRDVNLPSPIQLPKVTIKK
ncbi:hypothetical protein C0585_03320 [Candidatus Woesearchaeota archaeon]|nr:MAG: hypothetical protein C0585_03320 [Candidatus Woesearchaeota archaeon]